MPKRLKIALMVVTILFRWGSAKKIVHPAGITFKKFGGLAAKKIPNHEEAIGNLYFS